MTKCKCGEADMLNGVSTVEFMGKVHSAMNPCHEVNLADPDDEDKAPSPPEDTNLYQHALRELAAAGVQPEDQERILAMVREFASWHCSGGEASWYIHVLIRLLQYENLTALTDNPEEWNQVSEEGDGTWQSRRNPEAFSKDGGKTYYLLSEIPKGMGEPPTHTANDHLKPGG